MKWWLWLSLTGVNLALTTSVKMVGLFVFITIGIAVIKELWDMIDYKKGLPLSYIGKHFAARALCLILLPAAIYVSFFYIHFAVLTKSGPGDTFMSPEFQMQLRGNVMAVNSARSSFLCINCSLTRQPFTTTESSFSSTRIHLHSCTRMSTSIHFVTKIVV